MKGENAKESRQRKRGKEEVGGWRWGVLKGEE